MLSCTVGLKMPHIKFTSKISITSSFGRSKVAYTPSLSMYIGGDVTWAVRDEYKLQGNKTIKCNGYWNNFPQRHHAQSLA
jgi:hypothetical protein